MQLFHLEGQGFVCRWLAAIAAFCLARRVLLLRGHTRTKLDSLSYYTSLGGLRQLLFPASTASTGHWSIIVLPYIMWSSHRRSGSFGSDDSNPVDKPIAPAVLVYHESARSIVFRDHIRRESLSRQSSAASESSTSDSVSIANFQPILQPLPPLELSANDQFQELLEPIEDHELSKAEREVLELLATQFACIKTLKNSDWTNFLRRFLTSQKMDHHSPGIHDDISAHDNFAFNSFVTSTTLLPESGKKMRCYGSSKEYTTGVVFALPTLYEGESEDEAVARTNTWAWPSGYAAKTEFNIDSRGQLINGRQEALVPLSGLRRHNHEYVHSKDYELAGRMIKGGLSMVPYNEVFLRVGGLGRLIEGVDITTGMQLTRTLERGVGLPVALFVREPTFGHLVSLLRTRARVSRLLGQEHFEKMPLLLVSPVIGVRVLTQRLESMLMKTVSKSLNPFQNPHLAHKTQMESNSEEHLQQKKEELLDLDSDHIKEVLTPEERARLAGGFGATDDSVAKLLMEARQEDKVLPNNESGIDDHGHHLQDIVNEALASAVRSGDYHTSRQLLILYTLVAAKGDEIEDQDGIRVMESSASPTTKRREIKGENVEDAFCNSVIKRDPIDGSLCKHSIPHPPPPPPLDTDRLRSATNSDGLLAVLGAAQVLKAMQDGGAQKRVLECVNAIDEWIEHGENSVAFRLASWRDQRVAQDDLKIAMEHDSNFLAFVSNKAISNRKVFAMKLRSAASATSFQDVSFLKAIHEIVSRMHSPCLRLELLQYILGLDNRYSVAHLARSVELAGTCLSISGSERCLSLDNSTI